MAASLLFFVAIIMIVVYFSAKKKLNLIISRDIWSRRSFVRGMRIFSSRTSFCVSWRNHRNYPRFTDIPTQITVSFYGYLEMHKWFPQCHFLMVSFFRVSGGYFSTRFRWLGPSRQQEITVMARWGKVELHVRLTYFCSPLRNRFIRIP